MKRTAKLICICAAIAIIFTSVPFVLFPKAAVPEPSANNAHYPADNRVTNPDRVEELMKDAIVLYVGSPVALVNGVEKPIDTSDPEIAPVIKNGVKMVPLRFIAESYGADVKWDKDTLTASIVLEDKTISFTQGSRVMAVDNTEHLMNAEAQPIKGRTFVPFDKFAEVLGRKAFYDRGLIVIAKEEKFLDVEDDRDLISALIAKVSYLPIIGSYDKLMELLDESMGSNKHLYWGNRLSEGLDEAEGNQKAASTANSGQEMAKEALSNDSTAADYSKTNVQVQGVDEADIVKTDGEHIYQVNRQRVVVSKVYPPGEMKLLSVLDYDDGNFSPIELYLDNNKLIVIGSSWGDIPLSRGQTGKNNIFPPPRYYKNTVKTIIYDMTDREKLKKLREVEIEGNYVSSRKIGSELYIVSNKYIDYYSIQNSRENPVPSYRDTLDRDEFTSIDYGSIRYFPGIIQPNYLIVAGIDVNGDSTANIGTYLGAGQNIYASAQNLYITAIDFENRDILPMGGNTDEAQIAPKLRVVPSYTENTIVYKFTLKDAKATYLCKGVVPGRVLNQFSMDEYKGYFRIATTTGEVWRTDEQTSKNNLYILDDVLDITGKVEGMAPGETIYSVRFMGNRAYVVTFKTVDPLFVLDLKDPKNPSVLGALKIPGYSDYLHPYDENHIIGFGKDTVEVKGQAYYQGMKLALFDVSDVKNPIQKYTEIIGGRGTDSELLSNHKALLFSKEKNLLAFPVTVMEAENTVDKSEWEFLQYGQFTFQGAYVYNLNLTDGFKLLGRITHMSEEDYIKAGNGWYESDKNVKRILYIDDTLYTLSNVMIKANSLLDMKDRGELKIP